MQQVVHLTFNQCQSSNKSRRALISKKLRKIEPLNHPKIPNHRVGQLLPPRSLSKSSDSNRINRGYSATEQKWWSLPSQTMKESIISSPKKLTQAATMKKLSRQTTLKKRPSRVKRKDPRLSPRTPILQWTTKKVGTPRISRRLTRSTKQ